MAIKVSQAVIDEIKKKGMAGAIAAAKSETASPEFREGAKRMYGAARLGEGPQRVGRAVTANADEAKPAPKAKAKPHPMPKGVRSAAARKSAAAPSRGSGNADKMGEADTEAADISNIYEKQHPYTTMAKPVKTTLAQDYERQMGRPAWIGKGESSKPKKNKNFFAAAIKGK